MLGNLKIAVKRQKKLIIIFLMTIFLPSIALSIFGVRSIRNERFRLVKQLEDEHKRAADFLKNQISSRFADIEIILQNLAQHPSFNQKDYASIEESLNNQLKGNHLIEHVFLAYKDEESLFPLFLPVSDKRESTALFPLKSAQREKLERAQGFEFSQKNFYFWTILTILVLLTFGTVLVVRTIAHEMEVLRIKSDFVSSVSHEFKTPITSIKALIERFFSQRV